MRKLLKKKSISLASYLKFTFEDGPMYTETHGSHVDFLDSLERRSLVRSRKDRVGTYWELTTKGRFLIASADLSRGAKCASS